MGRDSRPCSTKIIQRCTDIMSNVTKPHVFLNQILFITLLFFKRDSVARFSPFFYWVQQNYSIYLYRPEKRFGKNFRFRKIFAKFACPRIHWLHGASSQLLTTLTQCPRSCWTFCPIGCFVQKDVLSKGHFVYRAKGIGSHRTLCLCTAE